VAAAVPVALLNSWRKIVVLVWASIMADGGIEVSSGKNRLTINAKRAAFWKRMKSGARLIRSSL